MGKYHLAGSIGLMFLLILIMGTACGKAEDRYVLGIDGYVYVAQPLSWLNDLAAYRQEIGYLSLPDGFQLVGESLYYQYETGDENIQRKTSAKSPSWTEGESIPYHAADADNPSPYYVVDEEGNLYYLKQGHDYEEYVDEEGNLYYLERGPEKFILYKQTSGGKLLYQLDLSEEITKQGSNSTVDKLALYQGDRVLVLLYNVIYIVDASGKLEGSISVEEYDMGVGGTGMIVGSLDGSVYYVANAHSSDMRVYEVVKGDRWEIVRVEAFTGSIGYGGTLYSGRNGLLFSSLEGYLYEYEKGASSLKPILKWEDSNLFYSYVSEVIPLSEEQLLVVTEKIDYISSSEIEQNMYLLERTPVEELPDQEIIVVASLVPDIKLSLAASEFNLQNPQYHVVLETYGASPDWTAALTRLDAAMVSGNPPDLLDLYLLDIYKYANKGALEDLNEYLEGSDMVHREDYLEGVIEGYTINGRLVCIPRSFYFMTVMGRRELFGDRAGWTMEECMELTEQYSEYSLENGRDASWILRYLCSGYLLERFVDWEARSSSFDSAEFCELLEWMKECGERKSGEMFTLEDALVSRESISYLYQRLMYENDMGEELTMIGFPTVDGREMHEVVVRNTLSMVSASRHKEGAWAFLEFFLGTDQNASYNTDFPTNQKLLQDLIEYYTTPPEFVLDENGERILKLDGNYKVVEGTPYKIFIGENPPRYYLEEEESADVLQAIESLDFTPGREGESAIVNIVEEEAAEYFSGDKEINEVVDIIQNRVQLLLSEGM